MNEDDYTKLADQAAADQWDTMCRMTAQMAGDLFDAFIRQGFTRDEAMRLLLCRLEMGSYAPD